jgi:hypothetical protein
MNQSRPRWKAIVIAAALTAVAAITFSSPAPGARAQARPDPDVVALANLRHITIAQAQRWMTAQAKAERLAPSFRRRLGPQFAGIWLDTAHPGRIKVATTGRVGVVTVIATELGVGSLVDPVHTAASLANLNSVQTDVVNTLRRIRGATGYSVGVQPQRGAAVLTLGPHVATLPAVQTAVTTLRLRHTTRLIIIHAKGEPTALSCTAASYFCDAPLRGGVRIDRPNLRTCTAGFIAKKGTARYVLTAGHCLKSFAEGWSSRYANLSLHWVGDVNSIMFPAFDFGAIKVLSAAWGTPKPWVYRAPPLSAWETYPIKGTATAVLGSFVCHTGATSGGSCGVVSDTNSFVSYGNEGFVVGAVTVSGGISCKGDSGGPVFAYKKAYGLLSGASLFNSTCGLKWFYFPLPLALSLLDMQLLTAS